MSVAVKTAASEPQKLSGVALYSRIALPAPCCSVTHGALGLGRRTC